MKGLMVDWSVTIGSSAASDTNLSGKQVKMPKSDEKIQIETTKIFWRVVGPSDNVRTFTRVDVDGTYKEKKKHTVIKGLAYSSVQNKRTNLSKINT